jgi:hypothetical protein
VILNLVREPAIHAAHHRRPACFFVIGERCSGTNFLQALLEENTDLYPSNEYGWKHGFPMFPAVSANAIAFVIFRNAIDWLRSMYGKPWHTSPMMRKLPFREFIRCRWDTIVDATVHFALPDGDPREGEVLQYDRHPITGRAFGDILDLRREKLNAHLGMLNREINTVLCTHEYLSREPEAFIKQIGEAFAVSSAGRFSMPKGRFGWPWPKQMRAVDLPPARLEAEDRAYVLSRLDLALEARIGYRY